MKQTIFFVLLFIGLWGCEQKPEAWFEPEDSIYFEFLKSDQNPLDSIYFSFGRIADDVHWDTIPVVVKFSGRLSGNDRTYRVKVLEKGIIRNGTTTMKIEQDYKALAEEQTMPANTWADTLKVVVCRDHINPSHVRQETKVLMLGLEASADFSLGADNGREMKVVVDNYLSEPLWWKKNTGILHAYHPEKYKILMSFKAALADPEDISSVSNYELNSLAVYLKDYLEKHIVLDTETGDRIFLDHTAPYPPTL